MTVASSSHELFADDVALSWLFLLLLVCGALVALVVMVVVVW